MMNGLRSALKTLESKADLGKRLLQSTFTPTFDYAPILDTKYFVFRPGDMLSGPGNTWNFASMGSLTTYTDGDKVILDYFQLTSSVPFLRRNATYF